MKFKTVDNIVYRIVTIVRYYKYKRNYDKTKPYSATNINHHTKGVQCFLDYFNIVWTIEPCMGENRIEQKVKDC